MNVIMRVITDKVIKENKETKVRRAKIEAKN